jgi:hypothetical protein
MAIEAEKTLLVIPNRLSGEESAFSPADKQIPLA